MNLKEKQKPDLVSAGFFDILEKLSSILNQGNGCVFEVLDHNDLDDE